MAHAGPMRFLRRIGVPSAAALLTLALLAPATMVRASSRPPIEGVPHLDHVFVVVLENENLDTTWHTAGTYLNGLLSQGAFASQYYGVGHVSADNYMAMTSGQMPTAVFNADCPDWSKCLAWEQSRPDGGVSVADQVDAAGKTWKAYMDGMTTPCKHPAPDPPLTPTPSVGTVFTADPYQSGYATRHDPFVYYPPIADDQARCNAHVVDYSQLATDLSSEATTPNYVFVTPDTCHDGHDSPCTGSDVGQPGWQTGGLTSANDWMSTEVPKLLASPAFTTAGVSSVLFITTDEAANSDATGCSTGPATNGATPGTCASGIPPVGADGGGLVGLLAIGSPAAHVVAGSTTPVPYDHDSLLRTVEDGLGLPSLTPDAASPVIFQDTSGHLNEAGAPVEHSMATLFSP